MCVIVMCQLIHEKCVAFVFVFLATGVTLRHVSKVVKHWRPPVGCRFFLCLLLTSHDCFSNCLERFRRRTRVQSVIVWHLCVVLCTHVVVPASPRWWQNNTGSVIFFLGCIFSPRRRACDGRRDLSFTSSIWWWWWQWEQIGQPSFP